MAEIPSRPVGRPPGTLQTAASVLTGEIIRSTKLMAAGREMVEEELKKVKKELGEGDMSLEVRLGVIKELTEIMQAVGKAVGDASRCLALAKGEESTQTGDIDVEAFLRKEVGRTG